MKLSAKTRYGIQALIVLARAYPDTTPLRVQALARECGAPEKYLVQIFQELRRAEMVDGVRGNGGGYRLKRNPDEILLREILDPQKQTSRPQTQRRRSDHHRRRRLFDPSRESLKHGEYNPPTEQP